MQVVIFFLKKKTIVTGAFFSERCKLIKIKMGANKSVNFVTFPIDVFKPNRR
jgi:hypothetical protein